MNIRSTDFASCSAAGASTSPSPTLARRADSRLAGTYSHCALAHGIAVNPHVWGSAVAQAASLQLIAAIPPVNSGLVPAEPLFEYDWSSHPMRQALAKQPLEHQAGWISISDRPGLGIEVDRQTIERFLV